MTSLVDGLVGLPAIVAFGSSIQLPNVLTTTIDLLGLENHAFIIPRDGTITNLSAFFSVTLGATLVGSDVNIQASLYASSPASNILTELDTFTLTPSLSGLISIGDTALINTSTNIPVVAGTRLALIMSITVTGVAIATALLGSVSAGITIE